MYAPTAPELVEALFPTPEPYATLTSSSRRIRRALMAVHAAKQAHARHPDVTVNVGDPATATADDTAGEPGMWVRLADDWEFLTSLVDVGLLADVAART